MSKKLLVFAVLALVLFAAGCTRSDEGPPVKSEGPSFFAKTECMNICYQKLNEGQNISAGPCLSNEIAPDWVCDVAHSPRQAVDDLPENQCSAYREGRANHFVEVDENCKFIRAF